MYKKTNLQHKTGYPGSGYYYVICDVCGKKMRAKDAIHIRDKFNLLNQMLVCPADADETNPQIYLRSRKEREIDNPRLIRSEQEDQYHFISDASEIETGDLSDPAGRVPEAPNLVEVVPVSSTEIELIYNMADPFKSPGSSAVIGYKIERESPVGGGFSTIVSNTGNPALYYNDTGVSAGTQYNYRISAINKSGTGAASNEKNTTTPS